MAEPENTTGAFLFLLYILAALSLISLILRDLQKYRTDIFAKTRLPRRNGTAASHPVLIFSSLAAISFSTLLCLMLNFVVQTYSSWALDTTVPGPRSLFESVWIFQPGSHLQIWRWATSSRHFQTFAKDLCSETIHFWWTQQALCYSVAWNTFMAIEGLRWIAAQRLVLTNARCTT
jgi:hypothetical protein